ncbi:hypothetical protein ABVV53_06490 [Novosphingobium sp. RD2P27]|uniref:Uncharacterized protein n=1 Tax=Novosphingobium kalidii TaxID=3230299 RepID=A0ABV2CZS3_9SPHN
MTGQHDRKSGTAASVMLAGSVSLLALPSAVLAFTADFSNGEAATSQIEAAVDDAASLGFSKTLTLRSLAKGKLFPFTPAGTPSQADRAVTVAVRVDSVAARAITVHGRPKLAQQENESGKLRIAPTGFSLGVSRGYHNFAQEIAQNAPRAAVNELPELREYSLTPSRRSEDSRFSPRISLEERSPTGRAPRTFAIDGGEVDLGGAYRVTENLNVTAGVRYSQERERLTPLTTDGKQDSQAVYVGTQFNF